MSIITHWGLCLYEGSNDTDNEEIKKWGEDEAWINGGLIDSLINWLNSGLEVGSRSFAASSMTPHCFVFSLLNAKKALVIFIID